MITTAMMTTLVILLIKTFILSHLVVKFEPLQWIIEAMKPLFGKWTITKFSYDLLMLASSCLKCTSLYIGWYLGGFWLGVIATFIAYMYSNLLQHKVDKIRFQ